MESGWERTVALPVASLAQILAATAPWRGARPVERVVPLPGGLVNLNLLLHLHGGERVVLRAHVRDGEAAAKERAVLDDVEGVVPAPRVLHGGEIELACEGEIRSCPFLLTTFVEGAPAASAFPSLSAQALGRAGTTLGSALARLHARPSEHLGFLDARLQVEHPMPDLCEVWRAYLLEMLAGRAGARLGARARDVEAFVASEAASLAPLEGQYALLHGDCKPTNVLVNERGGVTALLDWEFAWSGPPLFDLGQLFRWPVPEAFEQAFLRAYQQGPLASPLPDDWQELARRLDLMNLVGFLDADGDQPVRDRDVKVLIDRTLAS